MGTFARKAVVVHGVAPPHVPVPPYPNPLPRGERGFLWRFLLILAVSRERIFAQLDEGSC